MTDIALMFAEDDFRAGNPKPLADYIRKNGLPKGQGAFVASVIDRSFMRTKRDTHRAAEERRLGTLSSLLRFHERDLRIAAKDPRHVPYFKSTAALYRAVAKHHHMTVDALRKLESRARKPDGTGTVNVDK